MDITRESGGTRRWFADGKVVSLYKMFDWLRMKELRPSLLSRELVAEYIKWAEAHNHKWASSVANPLPPQN